VVCANSGREALKVLSEQTVSVILLDVMMPAMNGYEVLEAVHHWLGERTPPVIMLTARDTPDEIARAMELGAADYVTKPFDFRVLEARIKTQLKRARNAGALRTRASELEAHLQDLHDRQRLDALTGLANMRDFEGQLSRYLARARSNAESHVLCVCTLEEMQAINHTYGPATGDALLRTVARLLEQEIGEGDTLARLRGDKFAVLLANRDLASARLTAESMVRRLTAHSVIAADETLTVSVSVGLTPVASDQTSVMALIHGAEHACKLARADGSNQVRVYRSGDQQLDDVRSNMRWAMKLKQALREDGLLLYAQPIVACRPELDPPRRFEVLVRMLDEGRVVSPGMFLGAVEKHGLATELDRWVVENTIDYLAALPQQIRQRTEKVSINLSGYSLGSRSFRDFVVQHLRSAAIAPSLICFEITETAAVVHLDQAVAFIRSFQELGVTFALDDFGTGVSSFGYLRSLPVNCLKVDGQFVRHIGSSALDRGIVTAINDIAHIMGMETVAEFVEDQNIVTELGKIGVDFLQGYHLGRPQPLDVYLGHGEGHGEGAAANVPPGVL
jgi:Amt family ammonium transporter